MNWLRKIVITWMMATIVHAPFPVCDGDNLTSNQKLSFSLAILDHSFDLDFVLLGCDLPDDYDDGPLDVDPEHGSSFVFGDPFTLQSNSIKLDSLCSHEIFQSLCCFSSEVGVSKTVHATDLVPVLPFQNFSFGKLSQSGMAHFHC